MKILVAVFLLLTQVSFGQDCNTRAANKPATLAKTPDVFVDDIRGSSATVAKMKQPLGKAETWTKNLLTGFTGAKLSSSNDFYFDYEHEGTYSRNFYNSTGIKASYTFLMRFFAYYCYEGRDVIYTEGESGSFVRVGFNNVFISALCSDVGVFTINGHPVFGVLEKNHSEGRIDFYDYRAKSNVNDTIYTSKHEIALIRNSDKPVFIVVTRKEYLEHMLKDIETYRARRKSEINFIYTSQIKQFENEVKVHKQYDKNYTAEKEALQRKKFAETNNPQKLEQDLKQLDTRANEASDMVRQYLKKPQEWLSRSLKNFNPFDYSAAGLKDYFDKLDNFSESKEDLTRTEVVYINPAYFNKGLSEDIPQLIIVHLQKKAYPHMLKVSSLFNRAGALTPLEAILTPGK